MEPTTYSEVGFCRVIDFTAPGAESIDLVELSDRIAWDEEARVVVIKFGPGINRFLQRKLQLGGLSAVEAVARLKKPVIAAIDGDAFGAALELALACDIRIGINNALFGFPDIKDGLIPCNGGTQRLPRTVGQARALYMVLTGELIRADHALKLELVQRVVAAELLMNDALSMAQEMAAKSPLSLSYAKELLYSAGDLTRDQGIKAELDLYLLLFTTFDRTEGITAFREKRKPEFKGN